MTELQIKPSSNIIQVKYDTEHKVLAITFKNDAVYDYFDVHQETVDELLKAESVGKFFHANIKTKYECKARK